VVRGSTEVSRYRRVKVSLEISILIHAVVFAVASWLAS
jgi:hypothetical protein